jgi:hypothetical protein
MFDVAINYWAVLVAAIANMVIGSIWYAPFLFGRMWMQLVGKREEDMKKGQSSMYVGAGISALVMSYVFAHLVQYIGATTWMEGLQAGFWLWLGLVATTHLMDVIFSGKSLKLYGIQVGYHLVAILVMSVILTVWI